MLYFLLLICLLAYSCNCDPLTDLKGNDISAFNNDLNDDKFRVVLPRRSLRGTRRTKEISEFRISPQINPNFRSGIQKKHIHQNKSQIKHKKSENDREKPIKKIQTRKLSGDENKGETDDVEAGSEEEGNVEEDGRNEDDDGMERANGEFEDDLWDYFYDDLYYGII